MSLEKYDIDIENNIILENLIDVLKIKTFVWAQYECIEKNITKPYFKLNEGILVNYDSSMKYVNLFSVEKEFMAENYKIILSLDDWKFMYSVSFVTVQKVENKLKEKNNYIEDNCFIYSEVLFVFKKIKQQTQNKFKDSRFCCNIKSIFKTNISPKQIKLINKEVYKDITEKIGTKYLNHSLNTTMLNKEDVTYIFFYHPVHCKLNDIYGFEYTNTNAVNLLSKEIRIQKQKH